MVVWAVHLNGKIDGQETIDSVWYHPENADTRLAKLEPLLGEDYFIFVNSYTVRDVQ